MFVFLIFISVDKIIFSLLDLVVVVFIVKYFYTVAEFYSFMMSEPGTSGVQPSSKSN